MSMSKKFFEFNFFVPNIFAPMAVLALYCGSFAYFSSHFLIEGVSYVFASKLGMYTLFMLVALCLLFLIGFKSGKSPHPKFKYSPEKFHFDDLFLLLLPLTPVAQYVLNNREILSPVEILYTLALFTLFAALYIFAIPALLHTFFSTRILMLTGLAFVFTIASMASLSDYFSWFGKGTLRYQLALFGGAFLIPWLLYNLDKRKVLYFLIATNLATNSLIQLLPQNTASVEELPLSAEESKLPWLVGERIPKSTPNIYLLIYDSYVPNETMLAYGIDNAAQENYLQEQGFELYPHTYSVGSYTLYTMSTVLDVSAYYNGEKEARKAVSGNGVTHNILKGLGYDTYGLFYSDYMFRGIGSSYDYSIPGNVIPPHILLLKAILAGEFRFDIDDIEYEGQGRDQFIKAKQDVWTRIPKEKTFVYMHTNVPAHTQNSGACLPNEIDLYKERLVSANIEMRQDLQTITENDPDAIIIVAGDHGPHLTKNCSTTSDVYDASEISRLDVQDRYGTFLAIKWPTEEFTKYDNIKVLQDVFPTIFAYLYEDEKILRAKIRPEIPPSYFISGVTVKKGIIYGGIDDGEPLFLSEEK